MSLPNIGITQLNIIKEQNRNEKERINYLKQLLSIPASLRSQEQVIEIMEEMKNVHFLKDYKEKPEFFDLCRHLYLKTYEKKQCVFKQNDIGDAFYIILQGSVIVYIDEPTEYKNFMQLKEVAKLGRGKTFGDIALLYKTKRTATIICETNTDLIVLEKDIFSNYISEEHNPQLNKHLNKLTSFLEGLNIFTLMPQKIIVQLATKCVIKKYPSNSIILKQEPVLQIMQIILGNDASALYFVRTGRLKCVKLLPYKTYPNTTTKIKDEISDPTPEDIQKGDFVNEFIEIDELTDGDVFGDYSLLYQVEMDHSVITQIPSELVYITIYDVNNIIPQENLNMYKRSLKKYPNNKELRQIFWEKRTWDVYRKQLLKNIYLEKKNKNTWTKQLRQPYKRYINMPAPLNQIDIKTSDSNLYFTVLDGNTSKSVKTKKKVTGSLEPLLNKNHQVTSSVIELKVQLQKYQDQTRLIQNAQSSQSLLNEKQKESKTEQNL